MMLLLGQVDNDLLGRLAEPLGLYGYELGALIAVLLVSLICGMVGALVVGNRMAFFSDAMAHCAFAGVALGILLTLSVGGPEAYKNYQWMTPLIMVGFGALIGIGIAFVRERTALASDTVIGVFFAGAIGFGAMLLTALEKRRGVFSPEQFLFGSPFFVQVSDLVYLGVLLLLTALLLVWRSNQLVLGSFNTSLARTRRVSLRLNNYLFILLLALIVNFSITAVGVLLINGMLIVPAATASNLARNLRQVFWLTVLLSVSAGLLGLYLSSTVRLQLWGESHQFGPSGTIICLSVLGFFLSMMATPLRRGLRRAVAAG